MKVLIPKGWYHIGSKEYRIDGDERFVRKSIEFIDDRRDYIIELALDKKMSIGEDPRISRPQSNMIIKKNSKRAATRNRKQNV